MHIFSQLPYPDNYKAFKQRRGRSLKPLETPQRLAALPSGLDAGQVPSLADLEAAVAAAFTRKQTAEVYIVTRHAHPPPDDGCRNQLNHIRVFACNPMYELDPVVNHCVHIWPVIEVRTSKVRPLVASRLIALPALVSQTDTLPWQAAAWQA